MARERMTILYDHSARWDALVLDLMAFLLTPEAQAYTYDKGYFYPGPAVKDVPLSMAPKESQDAIKEYGRPGAANGWHFLTGDEANIKALTDAVGYHTMNLQPTLALREEARHAAETALALVSRYVRVVGRSRARHRPPATVAARGT